MLRNASSGQSSASSAPHGGASPGLDSQESPWIGLLSVLSRPALSLLNRILPGRTRTVALPGPDRGPGWLSGLLDDLEPGFQLDSRRGERGEAAALLDAGPDSCLPWIPAGSLEGLGDLGGLGDPDLCQHSQLRYLSTGGTTLQHFLLSSQDVQAGGGKDSGFQESGSSSVWGSGGAPWRWGLWGAGGGAGRAPLLDVFWTDVTGENLCPPQTKAGEPAPGSWTGAESARTPAPVPPEKPGSYSDPQIQQLLAGTRPDPRGPALPAPDPDNGYSSLEEEQVQRGAPPGEEALMEEESVEAPAAPRCQNRDIAFIMGCPCSDDDDDDSQSDATGDDGFDSDASSAASDSSEDEEDEEEEEEQLDQEAQRLWSSLSRSLDPYNPQNFSARLHTGTSSPSCSQPRDLPARPSPPPAPSASGSPGSASWDDSASASEADEAESLQLWSSFSCSDPYSPLNFQAPLRTRAPGPAPPHRRPAAPPRSREAAEDGLDSSLSEPCSDSGSCRLIKKVRFSDRVEEFFASGGEEEEDRRGPWEEFARDRCRFLRRCLEVEQSISFCLQPQHRQLVYLRLTANRRAAPSAGLPEAGGQSEDGLMD